jgi:hypothetical protein
MSDGTEKIYVDAGQSAVLRDGERPPLNYLTLQEAVIGWCQLPSSRKSAATIKVGEKVYTAQEIDRLHYGPKPTE